VNFWHLIPGRGGARSCLRRGCDFLFVWFADAALSRIDTPSEYPAGRVAGAIAVVTFARAASAVAVVIYLVAMAVVQVVPKYIRFCC